MEKQLNTTQFIAMDIIKFRKIISGLKDPGDCLGLYAFIYFCALLQNTNQPWITNSFIRDGLKWGHNKVSNRMQQLSKLGLITRIIAGRGKKSFIRIDKMLSVKKLVQILAKDGLGLEIVEKNPKQNRLALKETGKAKTKIALKETREAITAKMVKDKNYSLPCYSLPEIGRKCLKGYSIKRNALREINFKSKYHSHGLKSKSIYWSIENRYFLNKYGIKRNHPDILKLKINSKLKLKETDPKHPKNKYYFYIATKLKEINENYYDHHTFASASSWSREIRLLVESKKHLDHKGPPTKEIKKRLKRVLNHYEKNIGQEYAHELRSGKSFKMKFESVEEAIIGTKKKPGKIIDPGFTIHKMKRNGDG